MGAKPRSRSPRGRRRLRRSEVIAERAYELTTASGEQREVVLRIGKPVADGSGARCPIEVDGVDGGVPRNGFGEDAIQALALALSLAHVGLRYSEAFREGRLRWHGERDLGLPGYPASELYQFDWLLQDERGYAGLLAALLGSPAPFAMTFRRGLGRLVGIWMGHRPLDVSLDVESVALVAYPDPENILAIELALDAGSVDVEKFLRGHRLVRREEDQLAARDGRPPRRICSLLIAPDGPVIEQKREPDLVAAIEWTKLFEIFEQCQIEVGDMAEPVLPALCRTAVARYRTLSLTSKPRADGLTFDVDIEAYAGGSSRDQRALHRAARNLSWKPTYRRDDSRRITHRFSVTVDSFDPTVDGTPLATLLVEGLLAYARAFRHFLCGGAE